VSGVSLGDLLGGGCSARSRIIVLNHYWSSTGDSVLLEGLFSVNNSGVSHPGDGTWISRALILMGKLHRSTNLGLLSELG